MKTSKLMRATVATGMTLAAIGSMPLAHAEAATGNDQGIGHAELSCDGQLSRN